MRWLDGITDGHEFEQCPWVDDGQGSLACCSPWSRKQSDMSELLNWTEPALQTPSSSPSQWKTEYRPLPPWMWKNVKVNAKVLVTPLSPTLCNPVDCSPLGSMEFSRQEYWSGFAISFWGFPWPRDWTPVSCISGRFFTIWATREAHRPFVCISVNDPKPTLLLKESGMSPSPHILLFRQSLNPL